MSKTSFNLSKVFCKTVWKHEILNEVIKIIKKINIFLALLLHYSDVIFHHYSKTLVGNLRPTGQKWPARYFNAARVWLGRAISISLIKAVLFHFINNQGMIIEMQVHQEKINIG